MGDKLKILLVDDELDFLEVMGSRIKAWGYDLVKAANGKEAVEAVNNERPDVIVLDYMLPDMDGVATLKKIRKIDKKVDVIMLTAYPDMAAMKGAKQSGISAFIPKFGIYSDSMSSLKSAIDIIEKNREKQ